MRKRILILNVLLVVVCNAQEQNFPKLKGPYLGQKPPGMKPEIFALGIISTAFTEQFAYFTPDGNELYWLLKGSFGRGKGGFSFRTVLVVFQFATSIVLIICVGVVSTQLDYMQTKKLGFDQEHVVVLPSSLAVVGRLEAFKSRLLRNPGVLCVSAAKRVPSGRLLDSARTRVLSGETSRPISFRIAQLRVDADYIPTFRMEMAAGRNFSKERGTDFN